MSNIKNNSKKSRGKCKEMKFESMEKSTKLLAQPEQSYAECNIAEANNNGKDFETLMRIPTSVDGQLVLKSEKNWSDDVSGCFNYFTLDLDLVNAAMRCIPFNEFVQIKDEYLTIDQLTSFSNDVEEGKKAYKNILSNLETSDSSDVINLNKSDNQCDKKLDTNLKSKKTIDYYKTPLVEENNENDDSDDSEVDINDLLSLKSPTLQSNKKQMPLPNILFKNDLKLQSTTLSTKSNDFDTLLDSILGK